jgi:hypothetical protein
MTRREEGRVKREQKRTLKEERGNEVANKMEILNKGRLT